MTCSKCTAGRWQGLSQAWRHIWISLEPEEASALGPCEQEGLVSQAWQGPAHHRPRPATRPRPIPRPIRPVLIFMVHQNGTQVGASPATCPRCPRAALSGRGFLFLTGVLLEGHSYGMSPCPNRLEVMYVLPGDLCEVSVNNPVNDRSCVPASLGAVTNGETH